MGWIVPSVGQTKPDVVWGVFGLGFKFGKLDFGGTNYRTHFGGRGGYLKDKRLSIGHPAGILGVYRSHTRQGSTYRPITHSKGLVTGTLQNPQHC